MKRSNLTILASAALFSLALACDKKDEADKPATGAADAKAADAKEADAKEADAEGADAKVVACDQRDFVPEGEKKMAAEMGRDPKPKGVCMDYSNAKRSAGCAQGTPLDTPCPDEGVIATCTLEATGVVHKTYEGADKGHAKRMCKTLEGTFAEVE